MTTKLAVRHSTTTRMTMLLACFALAACASEDDDSDTNASATISTTIGSATNDPSTATDDPTAETTADPTVDPTDATTDTGVADTGTTDPTADTGSECTAQDECIDDSMCDGGMCIGCLCIGGGDTGATMSDYGSCAACGPGETPIAITGLEGFCFCSPMCDGAMSECPTPTSGAGGMAICGLGADAMNPTQCVVVCQDASNCPDGASCEPLETPQGTVGLCTHPA